MARGRTAQIRMWRPGGAAYDDVIVEEPLEIRLDGHLVASTMRTPGNDFELAAGFLHGEGMLGGGRVRTIRYCAGGPVPGNDFNVLDVDTGGTAPVPTPRLGSTTSSCGVCGSASIEALTQRLLPRSRVVVPDAAVLSSVPEQVRAAQSLFDATGSVHAAAAFDLASGALGPVREDVGRHNAVDKVVGHLYLRDRLPAAGGLFVSGRVSFEIVQKAWAAGFDVVAAVSGPSSLAVETARRANLTLVGFLREGSLNRYAPAPT